MADLTNTNDPRSLVEEIQKGNRKAFTDLCEVYAPLIDRTCRKYSVYIEEDELRQVCMIALYKAAVSFRTEQDKVTFGRFADVCMKNAVVSEMRRLRPTDALPEDENAADVNGSPEDAVIVRETLDELIQRMSSAFSKYERTVFVMYILGKTYSEIAGALGKSEASVGTAITRAKAKLRKLNNRPE